MKELRYTRQFKKDLKRFLNQPRKLEELNNVLNMLRNEIPLPEKYRKHTLTGEYSGCFECHIEGDFLLIWFDEKNNVYVLSRLGAHIQNYSKAEILSQDRPGVAAQAPFELGLAATAEAVDTGVEGGVVAWAR